MAVIVDGVLYSDESQAVIDFFWKIFGVVMLFFQGIFAPGSSAAYRPSSKKGSRRGNAGWGGNNGDGGPDGRGPHRGVGRPGRGDLRGLEGMAKMQAMGEILPLKHITNIKPQSGMLGSSSQTLSAFELLFMDRWQVIVVHLGAVHSLIDVAGTGASAIYNGELKLFASQSRKVVNIHLNRPSKLNALTLDQVACINSWVGEWTLSDSPPTVVVTGEGDRAFCAGGDVARMADEGNSGWNLRWFATEFQMNHRIHTYPSSWVSLWNGIVMGGGVGLSLYGSHRIAAENTIFSMPETGIGFVPDIGASYFLSRLEAPGLGLYL
ncbi:3-hydroxyisobutyryl-CoA hydrolase, partial [Perkinsus chesapeaki]